MYNGLEPWSENPNFFSKFGFIPDSLRPYIPLYRYILIDEGRYDKELLAKLKGAVAAFFQIDTVDLDNREAAAETIIAVLREMRARDPEVFLLLSKYIEGLHKSRETGCSPGGHLVCREESGCARKVEIVPGPLLRFAFF